MRLLFLINSLGRAVGGAERVLSVVGSELAGRGHAAEIASFDAPGTPDFYPIDPEVVRHRLGTSRLRSLRPLRSLIRSRRPDVAIGFMHTGFMPLAIAGAGMGIPLVASEHTVFAHYRTRPGLPILLRLFAPSIDASTVPSQHARDGYPPAIRRKMVVIPNPVVLPQIPRSADKGERRVLISVGNLRKEKGHATLIEAFAKLASDHPHWELEIAGEGVERQSLEEQVRRLGLGERVTFHGTVSDIASLYARADLFAMPSSYECSPLAAAEALMSGVPAIGFADCPGTNEIIKHEVNGLLVSGSDRAATLAAGLGKLMASAELRSRLAAAGPGSLDRHSPEAVADLWENLLLRLCDGRSLGL